MYYKKKELEKKEKKYPEEEKKVTESLQGKREECEQLDKEIEKIENHKIDKEKYIIKVNLMKSKYEDELLSAKKKIAERWNDFSAFREEHYIRDIEQKLQDDGIFDEVLNLVNDSTLLNSSMYNSKNYKKEGSYQDYVDYIYDKIDGKNDQL